MSDARRLATGSLAQQAAQVTGLVAMFFVIAVLARDLSRPELGVFGLLNALAGYLLIVQNAAAGAAVRAMAAARDERGGSAAFSTSTLMYVVAGLLAAVALAGYLLIVQNAAAGAAVRAMAAARDDREGSAAFSTSTLMLSLIHI